MAKPESKPQREPRCSMCGKPITECLGVEVAKLAGWPK